MTKCFLMIVLLVSAARIQARPTHSANSPKFPKFYTQVAAGNEHSCAVSDLGLECWGSNENFELDIPADVKKPTLISAFNVETCAAIEGNIVCWGGIEPKPNIPAEEEPKNSDCVYGGCEGSSIIVGASPPKSSSPKVKALSAASICQGESCVETDAKPLPPRRYSVKEPTAISNHWPGVCAIEGGVVKCWPRSDEFSWLKNIPRRLKTPVRAVAVSADFACALDELGVLCWGNDDHGQVSKVPELEKPVALASSAFRHKFAWGGGSFLANMCAIDGGKLKCWGADEEQALLESIPATTDASVIGGGCVAQGNKITCWTSHPNPDEMGVEFENPQVIVSGGMHSCALDQPRAAPLGQFTLTCWGYNDKGQTAVPPTSADEVTECQSENSLRSFFRNKKGNSTPRACIHRVENPSRPLDHRLKDVRIEDDLQMPKGTEIAFSDVMLNGPEASAFCQKRGSEWTILENPGGYTLGRYFKGLTERFFWTSESVQMSTLPPPQFQDYYYYYRLSLSFEGDAGLTGSVSSTPPQLENERMGVICIKNQSLDYGPPKIVGSDSYIVENPRVPVP